MKIYSTRDEAIQAEVITPLGYGALDHDIPEIAKRVIATTGEGTTKFGYYCAVDAEEFWDIAETHWDSYPEMH